MTFDPTEAIELERRHIREGEARIVRQEAISRLLDKSGNPQSALLAKELLASFREIVDDARHRLCDLERRYKPEPPTSV